MSKTTSDQIRRVCAELQEILTRKNADYADSFRKPGIMSGSTPLERLFVRMDDKVERIRNLRQNSAQVDGEGLKDSLMDLAGYSVLALILLHDDMVPQPDENVPERKCHEPKENRYCIYNDHGKCTVGSEERYQRCEYGAEKRA